MATEGKRGNTNNDRSINMDDQLSSSSSSNDQVMAASLELEVAKNFVETADEFVKSKQEELCSRLEDLRRMENSIGRLQNELTRAELQRDKAHNFLNEIEQQVDIEQRLRSRVKGEGGTAKNVARAAARPGRLANENSSSEAEENPETILTKIPEEVKGNFGQIMFSQRSSSSTPRPVLLLNPFRLPSGLVQDMWFDIYDELKRKSQLDTMPSLVYWYGGTDDPTTMFTMLQSCDLIPFEGDEKIEHRNRGLQQEQELSENRIIRAFKEMNDDLKKPPEHRFGPAGLSFLEFRDEESGEWTGLEQACRRSGGSDLPVRNMADDHEDREIVIHRRSRRRRRPASSDTHDLRPSKTVATSTPSHR